MRTGQGVGANGYGSGGGAGLRAIRSVKMGAIVEVDELVEAAAAEVMAVQLGAATATGFFEFLFLLTGAVTVS